MEESTSSGPADPLRRAAWELIAEGVPNRSAVVHKRAKRLLSIFDQIKASGEDVGDDLRGAIWAWQTAARQGIQPEVELIRRAAAMWPRYARLPVVQRALEQTGGAPDVARQAAKANEQPGRNDPCPCGSGKKFKKCHGGPGAAPVA